MPQVLATLAAEAIDTPAVCGLVGATVAAVVAHLRRRRMQKALRSQ